MSGVGLGVSRTSKKIQSWSLESEKKVRTQIPKSKFNIISTYSILLVFLAYYTFQILRRFKSFSCDAYVLIFPKIVIKY